MEAEFEGKMEELRA
jgi:chromosome segregation ATPase